MQHGQDFEDQRGVSRRRFLRNTAAAIGGLTLAACGGAPSSNTEEGATAPAGDAAAPTAAPAGAAPGQNNIVFWYWEESATKPAIDEFHKQHPDIKVEFSEAGGDVHGKLLTSLAAGSGAPDVSAIEIAQIGKFAGKGGLVDLLVGAFGAGEFEKDMVEYKWTHGSTEDGRLVGMPWDIGPGGLWYREDLFKAAGLESDPEKLQEQITSWDAWLELGKTLKEKTPETALHSDIFDDLYATMVEQQGHGWFEGNKLLFEEKATKPLQRAVEAREMGIDLKIEQWAAGGAEWANAMKKNGIAAMSIACWMQIFLQRDHPETAGKWRVIRAPEGDFNMGGSFVSIPEQSEKKEAAWEFVKYLCCTPEGQNIVFKTAGFLPAYKPAWEDPLYDQPVEFFGGQRTNRLWLDIADKVPGNVVSPNDAQASDIIGAEVTKVKKEGKDPVQAMKDAEAEALKRIKNITG